MLAREVNIHFRHGRRHTFTPTLTHRSCDNGNTHLPGHNTEMHYTTPTYLPTRGCCSGLCSGIVREVNDAWAHASCRGVGQNKCVCQ